MLGFPIYVVLLLSYMKPSFCQTDCSDVVCEPTVNCIDEVLEEGSCCPVCAQLGCTCEGYQYYDCVNVGFKDGKVPEGESYFVDFGSTECSCAMGGGRISCDFIPCPELPPNCIDVIQPADACIQCGRIGCVHGSEKYEAGHTFHMSQCKFCHCPNTGGDLMCYAVPQCDTDANSTTHLMDTTESDPERQYDYPYSHEQDPLDSTSHEVYEKNNNFKRNAMQDHSMLDYNDKVDDDSLSTTMHPTKLVQSTNSHSTMPFTSQPPTLGVSTDNTYITENSSTMSLATSKKAHADDFMETTTQPTQQDLVEQNSPTPPTPSKPTDPNKVSTMGKGLEKEETPKFGLQVANAEYTFPTVHRAGLPEEEKEASTFSQAVKATTAAGHFSPSPSAEPQVLFPVLLAEGRVPQNNLNHSRSHDGSAKEMVETCCAAGQQWSIDHGECEKMPFSADDDCRLAEKQCCISYVRENTCIAGMIAAKEDGICLPTEHENCERSHFKLCCNCCSLGLKIRNEGHSCESNLNLGYPCNHMIILCCNGEEQLLPPEVKVLSKTEATPKPDKDVDECALNTHTCVPGERCINTAQSFVCIPEVICETGFLLEDGVCQDINECASVPAPCKQGFTCVNTLGSYVCQRKHLNCNKGYKANDNGTMCIDIDECSNTAHNCSAEQSCYNLPGTYRCDCKAGYRYDTFRRKCMDVNECEQNPCNQECSNIYGSYQCYCKPGYKLGDDGITCEDIDECIQSIGSICVFACINTPGSYQCACPEHGYTMSANGLTCKDIDECEIGTHNCSSSEECYNIQGSYKCLAFDCPENYRRVSNMKCERNTCSNYLDCQNTPTRISYHRLTFPTGVVVPAQIFRIAPSPAYAGDNIIMDIKKGNEENYFSARKFNPYTGILYLQRPVRKPKDFLLDVEMKLFRQGMVTSFLSRIYIFITAAPMS
ncbi:fibulin-2-like isoform X2 [Pseudophryne corroboree]|uniref:fibulin-2-like isoform X2 n=1 Tax=Pseudophryne corroboree TaxID=495146 RepID=UPI003081521A